MHTRSFAKFGAVGLAAVLALTACSSSKKKTGTGLTGGSTSAAASAASGATVKIGFEGPLSGDNAQLGINEVNAVQLAVDQANSTNSFGFKVTLEAAAAA